MLPGTMRMTNVMSMGLPVAANRFCRGLLMLGSTIALIAAVTPFALPPLIPILLLFYFIYLYFQVHNLDAHRHADMLSVC